MIISLANSSFHKQSDTVIAKDTRAAGAICFVFLGPPTTVNVAYISIVHVV